MSAPFDGPRPASPLLRLLRWVDAHPRLAALALALACAWPLVLTVQFFSDVRAGFTELLPPTAPAVRAIEEIQARLGSQARLVVIVESPDGEANRRFVLELGERLKARRLPEAKSILLGCHLECEWARDRILLLLPTDRFQVAIEQAEKAIQRARLEANPLFVDLEDPPAQTDPRPLEEQLERELERSDRFPTGFFETPGGKRVVMMILLAGSETELDPAKRLLAAVQQEITALRPGYPPGMVVAFNGELANLIEEHDAIVADIALSSLVVFLLVGGVILVYFRSLRGLVVVLFALLPGLIVTFAIGRLTVGHLNSNTAFLGSIIAGNGINFPLLVLAYYRHRSRDEERPLAVLNAIRQGFFGTLAAALAASAAYGGLAVSHFRGFSQFGWLGGLGMITTWAFTMIAMPIAIGLFDPPRSVADSATQRRVTHFFGRPRLPGLVAGAFIALSLAGAACGVRHGVEHGIYETDLLSLRNRDSLRSGSASWDARLAQVMGVWLNPVAALVDDPATREPLAAALRQRLVEGPAHLAERVETIEQWVKPLPEQQQRLERLKKLSKAIAAVPREKIPPKLRPWLDRAFKPHSLEPITLANLPPALKANFAEVNGRTDRVVLLFPSLKINYDDSRNVLTFVDELQKVDRPVEAVIGGGFLFMAEIIRLVHNEGPKIIVVVAVLVGLVLLPLLIRRPLRILLVVGTVGIVALLAQANLLAVGVRLNMLDFAALPITIGIGSDYVVNLLGAMDAYQVDARRACARMGGAIFLCSLTTTIGYASLLMAQSGALRSFGWAAICGEVMAAAAVLVVLPVLLARRIAAEPPA